MAERLSDEAALDEIQKDVVRALKPDGPSDEETLVEIIETLEANGRPLINEVAYAGGADARDQDSAARDGPEHVPASGERPVRLEGGRARVPA